MAQRSLGIVWLHRRHMLLTSTVPVLHNTIVFDVNEDITALQTHAPTWKHEH